MNNKYLLDIAVPAELQDGSAGVQFKSYVVEGESAGQAVTDFLSGDKNGKIVYEGDPTKMILVGVELYEP